MKVAKRQLRRRPTIYGLQVQELARLAKQAVRAAVDETLAAGIPVTGMVDGRLARRHPDGTIEYIVPSSVYKELGYEDAEGMALKADLVKQLLAHIQLSAMPRNEVAALVGLPEHELDAILRGRFRGVPVDALSRMVRQLSDDL